MKLIATIHSSTDANIFAAKILKLDPECDKHTVKISKRNLKRDDETWTYKFYELKKAKKR